MPWSAPVLAYVGGNGALWCVACLGIDDPPEYEPGVVVAMDADNSALDDQSCDFCGKQIDRDVPRIQVRW